MTETLQMLQADVKLIELEITAIRKRKEYLQNNVPEDIEVDAWCADKSEELSGVVGTVEVPGELGILQIKPGYFGESGYSASTDGQLLSTVLMSPSQCFFNTAILPGWQKWRPMYRHGTLTSKTDSTGSVILENVVSSQQDLGINQSITLTNIPIEYMNCNGKAFDPGDEVLVRFTGQEFSNAKIIGFKDHPKTCPEEEEIYEYDQQSGMVLVYSGPKQ